MSLDVFLYRLMRNRRVILFGVALPVLVVVLTNLVSDHSHPLFMALAIAIPAAHAIRYSNAVQETFIVSLTLSLCLLLAAMNPPGLALASVLFRTFWLLVLALIVFFVLTAATTMLPFAGPSKQITLRVKARSKLSPQDLRQAITYYPGREDERVTCGPADERGIFDVETRLVFQEMSFCGDDADGWEEGEGLEFLDAQAMEDLKNGIVRTRMKAMVYDTSDVFHEVFVVDGESDEVITTRYAFKPLRNGGTAVTYSETGAAMPLMLRFSFWLSDYTADYLTDEIERAEGRSPRANRAIPNAQLLADIAGVLVLLMPGSSGPASSDGY